MGVGMGDCGNVGPGSGMSRGLLYGSSGVSSRTRSALVRWALRARRRVAVSEEGP